MKKSPRHSHTALADGRSGEAVQGKVKKSLRYSNATSVDTQTLEEFPVKLLDSHVSYSVSNEELAGYLQKFCKPLVKDSSSSLEVDFSFSLPANVNRSLVDVLELKFQKTSNDLKETYVMRNNADLILKKKPTEDGTERLLKTIKHKLSEVVENYIKVEINHTFPREEDSITPMVSYNGRKTYMGATVELKYVPDLIYYNDPKKLRKTLAKRVELLKDLTETYDKIFANPKTRNLFSKNSRDRHPHTGRSIICAIKYVS